MNRDGIIEEPSLPVYHTMHYDYNHNMSLTLPGGSYLIIYFHHVPNSRILGVRIIFRK